MDKVLKEYEIVKKCYLNFQFIVAKKNRKIAACSVCNTGKHMGASIMKDTKPPTLNNGERTE